MASTPTLAARSAAGTELRAPGAGDRSESPAPPPALPIETPPELRLDRPHALSGVKGTKKGTKLH